MTVFHLIRHAEHDQLGRLLTGRTADVHLSDRGRAQAQALAQQMSRISLDAVWSSPQHRARETAAPIAAAAGLECRISRELDEIDFGAWAGLTFEALEGDPAWRRWNAERDKARTPGGETMLGVADRVIALIEALHRAFASGNLALVSHSDVIKSVVCRIRGWPFQSVHGFEIAPASVTTILLRDGRAEVSRVNGTIGLPAPEAVA